VIKEAQYWVGLAEWHRESEIKIQESEVEAARWLCWKEAMELITLERKRKLLATAMELLDRE
jgi:hypothetical protein